MAAVGILAALREREHVGEGHVDVSMFDGSLSWLAMVAAKYLCDGVAAAGRQRAERQAHLLPPLRLRRRWVTLGALEPKFWQAWCGVGREDLIEPVRAAYRRPRGRAHLRRAHARAVARVRRGARLLPRAGTRPGEALDSELVRAREMVVQVDQPGTDGVRLLGVPVKLSRTPGAPAGPALPWASTRGRCSPFWVCPATRSTNWSERARWREPERPSEDEGAGRGQRCERRHDQALPA